MLGHLAHGGFENYPMMEGLTNHNFVGKLGKPIMHNFEAIRLRGDITNGRQDGWFYTGGA